MTSSPHDRLRVLLLSPQGMEPDSLLSVSREVEAAFRKAKRTNIDIVLGTDWYSAHFQSFGNLKSWAVDAVTGKRYSDRQPHFHGFVLFGAIEEEAAVVASCALSIGKSVLFFVEDCLTQVSRVQQHGSGWTLHMVKERPRV